MWKSALFLSLLSTSAWGYNLTQDFTQGFYWANLPISIHVVEKDAEKKETLEQLAKDAIGEWEARTGLSLWTLEGGTPNIIRWSNKFAEETQMDPTTVLAVAIRYTEGPYFARTEIVINGNHPLNHVLSNLLTTITHELGHTVGLDHSSESEALMAPTLQDPYHGLHTDDVNGMTYAFEETQKRQITKYVSPLAFEQKETKSPLSCGTVSVGSGSGGAASLVLGMLTALLGRLRKWFKSLF